MSKTGDIVTIKMTDDPDSSDFEYMAHRRGDTQKDVFYIGAYLGSVISNKLRSLSEQRSSYSEGETLYRTYARNNTPASNGNGGSGYDIFGWYQLVYLQCMYVLKYKNLNSQLTIGYGVVVAEGHLTSGGANAKGMDWGTTADKTSHMKLFGIEDFYGNDWEFIDGVYSNSDYHILTATENFNTNGTGYTDRGAIGITSQIGRNYSSKVIGTTHGGFMPCQTSGSATTYYCDHAAAGEGVTWFGSDWNDEGDTGAGVFAVLGNRYTNAPYSDITSRLMYL